MLNWEPVLLACGAAALTAALAVLLYASPWRRPDPARAAQGGALGVGFAFALACLVLGVEPAWPPVNDLQRLLLVLWPAAVLIEVLAAFPVVPRVLAWAGRLAVAGAVTRILLHGTVYFHDPFGPGRIEWTTAEACGWLGGLAAALTAVWVLMALLARRSQGRSVLLALAVTCAGAGVTVAYSCYLTAGLLGLPLAAALAGAAAASLVFPRPEGMNTAVGVGLVGLFALLVDGRFFGTLPLTWAAFLLAAPLLCWVPELPCFRAWRPWQRGLCRVVLVLVPVGLIVWLAEERSKRTDRPNSPTEDVRSGPQRREPRHHGPDLETRHFLAFGGVFGSVAT